MLAGATSQVWTWDDATKKFVAGKTLTGVTGVTSVALVDVDDDHALDIVLGGTTVTLFKNKGTAVTPLDFADGTVLATAAVTSLAVADLDGDGYSELVVGASDKATQLLANRGVSGTWQGFKAAVALGPDAQRAGAIVARQRRHRP